MGSFSRLKKKSLTFIPIFPRPIELRNSSVPPPEAECAVLVGITRRSVEFDISKKVMAAYNVGCKLYMSMI
ncbi:MAG: hypothetical protein A2270_08920 [Elusimicrobia bacterium RIFOXYA12_FULL_51_18]|nr:MAG: hypothetical protein A2270_08920 [Elusimicrobia bacterium RIFOXYA12_FULL_51_18]OGS32281.1 MAG: hypothetical protein A2218_02695 [Elusimicrobia bacterium RIFOXYA2_FULL_53_38]